MENRHHSRKRKHTHEHKSRHGESGKHRKHGDHDSAHQRHARGRSTEISAAMRQPLAVRDQNELSGDKSYVRSWLAQTQNESIDEPLKQPSPKIGRVYSHVLC